MFNKIKFIFKNWDVIGTTDKQKHAEGLDSYKIVKSLLRDMGRSGTDSVYESNKNLKGKTPVVMLPTEILEEASGFDRMLEENIVSGKWVVVDKF